MSTQIAASAAIPNPATLSGANAGGLQAGTPAPTGEASFGAQLKAPLQRAESAQALPGTQAVGQLDAKVAAELKQIFQSESRPVEASQEASSGNPFHSEGEAMRTLPTRWRELRERVVGAMTSEKPISNSDLLLLQIEVQEMSFQVETASKVVEHATSGTKTVLQTQA